METSTRPLRIAMVCDIVPGQAGGSYLSAVRFAERLRARGHHVILIGSRDSRQQPVENYNGIPVYQFFAIATPGSHRYYFQSFPTKRQLREVFEKEQIEIVHIMFASYSCGLAKKLAKEMGLALVAHIHTQPENVIAFLPKWLQTRFVYNRVACYLANFVKDAKQIVCPSEMGKRIYLEVDPFLPITVISNGVDPAVFHQIDPTPFKEKYRLTPSRKTILFIGRFTPEKDPMTVLKAFPEILKQVDAQLIMIGTGPLTVEAKAYTEEKALTDRVSFLGKVSDEDLLGALNACDVFVLPSHAELEGMVVLEAMACSKPILIADDPNSASRFFVKDNGYLFTPWDTYDLARKALTILRDNGLRKQMEAASAKDVLEYEIDASVKKLEEVYRVVCA